MDAFFKFPTTPHLWLLDDIKVRGDKVMSDIERKNFLQHEIVVEEKVDGANLGISFDSEGNICAQNRGAYLKLPSTGQWKKLINWLNQRTDILFEHLSDRYILFGEWCYAQHSVIYDQLPDWFLGFDIYDKQATQFFSSTRRDKILQMTGICQVPQVDRGYFTLSELESLLSKSHLSNKPMEGLYLRCEKDDWLTMRAKLVRPNFIQSIERHWSNSDIKLNKLKSEYSNTESGATLKF